jgi:hypothetical protein
MKLPPPLTLAPSQTPTASVATTKIPTTTTTTTMTTKATVSLPFLLHHSPQEPGSFPTPLTPASTTAGEVSFHYKMGWTTTIYWLLQLTRKKTRWKAQAQDFIFPAQHTRLSAPPSALKQTKYTKQATHNRVKYGWRQMDHGSSAAVRPYDAIRPRERGDTIFFPGPITRQHQQQFVFLLRPLIPIV